MSSIRRSFAFALACSLAPLAFGQVVCPDKNVFYWQAFPPGGESDIAARHQQLLLHRKCPAIDAIVQYKSGAGGGVMWSQMNQLPGDGYNVVGVNLPHIVMQPMEGEVQYKTQDITPVFWFHFTPDALVVPDASPYKTFKDFIDAAKKDPGKMNLGGSGLNSANHASHERLNSLFGIKTQYVPYKGTGDMTVAVLGSQVDGAVTYTAFAINNKGRVRALAVAMDKRHPLLPDVPTFRELGVDWVDGAWRGIGVPKSTPPEARKRLSDLWAALNADPEMKELAFKSGFELVNVGLDQMDAFMKDKVKLYTESAQRLGLGEKAVTMRLVPERVRTERLELRLFTLADHAQYARICSDPDVMRYVGAGQPNTPEITWRSMAGMLGHWQLLGYGLWAVTLRESSEVIGHAGFIDVLGWPGFELAWLLGREYWGRGYALEAASAALRIAQEELKKDRIISLIRPGNAPSIKLATKLGAQREKTVDLMDGEAELFVHMSALDVEGKRRA